MNSNTEVFEIFFFFEAFKFGNYSPLSLLYMKFHVNITWNQTFEYQRLHLCYCLYQLEIAAWE